jgi:uncharacterized protein YfdQ (DUF2303 family)
MADRTEHESLEGSTAGAISRLSFEPDATGNFAVVPDGWTIQGLEQYQERPNRHTACPTFVEVKSLAEYVNRFRRPDTMITASYDAASIVAVIDGDAPDLPAWREHYATFAARIDETLEAWLKISGKALSQVDFGLFLEDHAVDVVVPEAAAVMDMVMTFDATNKVVFKSAQRLSDGSRQFQYVEENEAKGGVTLPDHFMILAPVYRGMEPQRIKFMVRYRIDEGKLRFQVDMHDRTKVMRDAFQRCLDAFRTGLKDDAFIYVTS